MTKAETTPEAPKPNRNAQFSADITALLKARNTLIWVVTREEHRVENAIVEAAAKAGKGGYETVFWDCCDGICKANGDSLEKVEDATGALTWIEADKARRVYIMRDLTRWLADPVALRKLRNLARKLQRADKDTCRTIIVLTPSTEVPPELQGHTVVLDFPLPERPEIETILNDIVASLPPEVTPPDDATKHATIDAAIGMNSEEISACFARSIVLHRRFVPAMVAAEKRRVVARERVLTWYEPDPRGLAAVGGLENLKEWLSKREKARSPAARDFGCGYPRGLILVGIPGCGKSLTAKAVSTSWGIPLLRLDLGAIKSKWVGESEANIRRALTLAETVSPCVLWIDEVEKALAGSTGPQGDGGVGADSLSALLTWMQEREGRVFVIATANQAHNLPAEFIRRFDAVFALDLPTAVERREILEVSIRAVKRDPATLDLQALVRATQGFTGAEISGMISEALYDAFADDARPLTTDDLIRSAESVVPLAQTSAEKIDALRKWAVGRAKPASIPEVTKPSTNAGRAMALDV